MDLYRLIESENNLLYIFRTFDKHAVEAVYTKKTKILCISTQVGCDVNCFFCASSKKGFFRNLTVDEILFQVNYVVAKQGDLRVVHFAGIGEPLNNFKNVLAGTKRLKKYIQHIQLTTSVPSINLLESAFKSDFSLITISLHSMNTNIRQKIVPKSVPLQKILAFLMSKISTQPSLSSKVYLGYILLKGINDNAQDILKLFKLAESLNLTVYFMFCNKITAKSKQFTTDADLRKIVGLAQKKGLKVKFSSPSRRDAVGGCGTLRINRAIFDS